MREEGCKVCGAELGRRSVRESLLYGGIFVDFEDVCEKHIDVLRQAYGAITIALIVAKQEEQERVLAQLFDRLHQNGFEVSAPVSQPAYRRRHVSSSR